MGHIAVLPLGICQKGGGVSQKLLKRKEGDKYVTGVSANLHSLE